MEYNAVNDCFEEWQGLSKEYIALENLHQEYHRKLNEVTELQQKCVKGISHQRYRIGILKKSLQKIKFAKGSEDEAKGDLLQTDFLRRKAQLYEMENILPKPNGLYLKIILGNINVSILDKAEKFKYKDEYEKFKMVMSLIALGVSVINLFTNFRTLDLVHMFLLVWYYCTLTIRESILKVNGSKINGWWRTHHFISTVLSGILLIWPNGEAYYAFRSQFMAFNVYISFVQYLQFMYQRGCLYRLKALGERHNMDVTVEGFHSWMWRGLGFLLPFLYVGYLWELYNAYTLYLLSFAENVEWHVYVVACLFFVLFLGNIVTTSLTIPNKIQERVKLKYRFTRLNKYFWTHKKRKVSFRTSETPAKNSLKRIVSFSKDSPIATRVPEEDRLKPDGIEQKDDLTRQSSEETQESEMDEICNEIDELAEGVDFEKVDRENEETSDDSDKKTK